MFNEFNNMLDTYNLVAKDRTYCLELSVKISSIDPNNDAKYQLSLDIIQNILEELEKDIQE